MLISPHGSVYHASDSGAVRVYCTEQHKGEEHIEVQDYVGKLIFSRTPAARGKRELHHGF